MSDSLVLEELGFSQRWQAIYSQHVASSLIPARIIRSDRGSAIIVMTKGIARAKVSVRLLKSARGPADLPVVGDWVMVFAPEDLDVPQIEVVLERASAIVRAKPGKTSGIQVLAANVDTVFVVHPIAEAPNLRRIERELSLAWESSATPVVVLTKADLSADPKAAFAAVESIASGADVILVNALDAKCAGLLIKYILGHRTAVLIGPSGAGKSTLINTLLRKRRQATREIRIKDGRGRHITVARELIQIPAGGMIIDTPGLRALGLTGVKEGINSAFPDIEKKARSCRFRDCKHNDEPGCAVRSAVDEGTLSPERLVSYHKLIREAQVAALKTDTRLRLEEKNKKKIISKAAKDYFKRTGRR